MSLTDPQTTYVSRKYINPFFTYDTNYLIHNKLHIIIDTENTHTNHIDKITITETIIYRVKRHFNLTPKQLTNDTTYNATKLLK